MNKGYLPNTEPVWLFPVIPRWELTPDTDPTDIANLDLIKDLQEQEGMFYTSGRSSARFAFNNWNFLAKKLFHYKDNEQNPTYKKAQNKPKPP